MTQKQVIELQTYLKVNPDGFWGPKSIEAAQVHLRRLMPSNNPWPRTDEASLTAFYGQAGDESKLTNLDVAGLGLKYAGKSVKTVRCHYKVAESLKRVLAKLPVEILSKYDGCYNNRPMRGGSRPSLHARGAAVDFDAGNNGNRVSWPLTATMPFAVMEAFAREGWLAAGAFWSRDAMHFQATQ